MVFGISKKDKKRKAATSKSDSKVDTPNPVNGDNVLGDLFNFSESQDSAEKGNGVDGDKNIQDGQKRDKNTQDDDKDTKDDGKSEFGNGGGVLEDVDAACTLPWKARLAGFIACFIFSLILVGLAYLFIVLRKIPAFAVVYSIGSIVAILSTGFLVGPLRQFKVMMEKGRIVATIIYVVAIIVTIVVGVKKMLIPAVICMLLQVVAFIFYSLTFMPFVGRYIKRKCSIPTKLPKV